MPGIKGSSSPCLSISFLQGCAHSYFHLNYFQSQTNLKAALSDFWPLLMLNLLHNGAFHVFHATYSVFHLWQMRPKWFLVYSMLKKCCGTVGRLLNADIDGLHDKLNWKTNIALVFSLFDSKSKITFFSTITQLKPKTYFHCGPWYSIITHLYIQQEQIHIVLHISKQNKAK